MKNWQKSVLLVGTSVLVTIIVFAVIYKVKKTKMKDGEQSEDITETVGEAIAYPLEKVENAINYKPAYNG